MTLTTTAQEQPAVVKKEKWGASKKADKMSDKLGRQLGLTREQNKQIFSINEDIARRRDVARRDSSLTARQRMHLIQNLDTERSHRFKNVLTPAQFKKWNDWQMQKKEHLEAKMDRKQARKQARKARHDG